jgi:hypothetical protein
MKTKLTLLLGVVALVTLSFTFANVNSNESKKVQIVAASNNSTPIGGIVADEVIK